MVTAYRTLSWVPIAPRRTRRSQVPGTAHSGADASVIWEYNGTTSFQFLGDAVAGVGDIDGDGRGDFAIATPNEDLGATNAGRARIYSGATGSLIHSFVGANGSDNLGASVDGAGLVDGDAAA